MDEISEAFQDVSVADFERKTSAVAEQAYGDDFTDVTRGVTHWNTFVDGLLLVSRSAAAKPGEFQPWAVLHSPNMQRTYVPDADETVVQFSERLRREAHDMGATWFFTAILSCGRAYNSDEDPPTIDPDNIDELQDALDRGEIEVAICWYAELREGGDTKHRAGIIGFTDGAPNQGIEGDIDADKNPFHYVLT